jgi:hypothetical protein
MKVVSHLNFDCTSGDIRRCSGAGRLSAILARRGVRAERSSEDSTSGCSDLGRIDPRGRVIINIILDVGFIRGAAVHWSGSIATKIGIAGSAIHGSPPGRLLCNIVNKVVCV